MDMQVIYQIPRSMELELHSNAVWKINPISDSITHLCNLLVLPTLLIRVYLL